MRCTGLQVDSTASDSEMGVIPTKPEEEEVLLWQVSGRKPYFVDGDFWAAQQAQLQPYLVQGKVRCLSLREAQHRIRELGLRVVPNSFIHTYTANGWYRNGIFTPEFPDSGTMGKVPVALYNDYNMVDYRDSPYRVRFAVSDDEKSTMIEWNLVKEARVERNSHRGCELSAIMKDKLAYKSKPLGFGVNGGDKESDTSSNLANPEAINSKPKARRRARRARGARRIIKESKADRRKKKQSRVEAKEERRIERMLAGRVRKEEQKRKTAEDPTQKPFRASKIERDITKQEKKNARKVVQEVEERMDKTVLFPALDLSAKVWLFIKSMALYCSIKKKYTYIYIYN